MQSLIACFFGFSFLSPLLFSFYSLTLSIIMLFPSPNPHSFPPSVDAVCLQHAFIVSLCPELPSLFPLVFHKRHSHFSHSRNGPYYQPRTYPDSGRSEPANKPRPYVMLVFFTLQMFSLFCRIA